MGEKKAKFARLRADALRLVDDWTFAPTQWERETVAEIEQLPAVTVSRVAPEVAIAAGMQPRLCFGNSEWCARNDVSGGTRAVIGWIVEPAGNYVLHAVVRCNGQYLDWTPLISGARLANTFAMIPDPTIVQNLIDGLFVHTRDGHALTSPGLRRNPERTKAAFAAIRTRLEMGMDPFRAFSLPV